MALSKAETTVLSAILGTKPGGAIRILGNPLIVWEGSREHKAALSLASQGLVVVAESGQHEQTFIVYTPDQYAVALVKANRAPLADPYDFGHFNDRSMVYDIDTGAEVATFKADTEGKRNAERVCKFLNGLPYRGDTYAAL